VLPCRYPNPKYLPLSHNKKKELVVSDKVHPQGSTKFNSDVKEKCMHEFSNCMVDMFTVGEEHSYSDYTTAVDEERIPVNRCIVAQRSHYFRLLFSTPGTVEAEDNCLSITDVSSATVKASLKFIYTGAVDNKDVADMERKEALLRIAEKYQLCGLKELMEQCIGKEVNSESFFHLAAVSDMYSARDLRR